MSGAPAWRPPHAYVPGQSARHPDALFDRFSFSPFDIAGSERWSLALELLREGYFWETHELLEPIWMGLEPGSRERDVVQGLIQLANAGLKRRMGRPGAVARLKEMAAVLLCRDGAKPEPVILGLSGADIAELWNGVFDSN